MAGKLTSRPLRLIRQSSFPFSKPESGARHCHRRRRGMTRLRGTIAAVAATALVVAAPAVAGSLVLHPSGFGEHSYSSWKGGEGLADSTGAKQQALYFQKNTATA